MSEQVHLAPANDEKDHLVSFTELCWCGPQVQQEDDTHATIIHKPIRPVVEGHRLDIKKFLVTASNITEIPGR